MVFDGARIYREEVALTSDIKLKIRQIVRSIKNLTLSSDISLKLIKSGNGYEAMLWGTVNDKPIGVYNRGASISIVLENILKRAQKECLKASKSSGQPMQVAI